VLEHSLTIMVVKRTGSIDVPWDRSIKRIETTTLNPGLDPKETDAKSASSESPE
jgi:hypothetical protein